MRNIVSGIAFLLFVYACTTQSHERNRTEPSKWWSNSTIYEVNTRQFSPKGTFAEVEKQLPRLKELGVDILWFMPVQPIGKLKRKGTLGSYYSIADYTGVNPEFGTIEDFKRLVSKAHELGMKVILDWVANHTSWDAKWINNPSWYSLDSLGKKHSPYDWTDVVKLNYKNDQMKSQMIEDMKYWVKTTNIDGFRADVAHEVPTAFWEAATDSLRALKSDLFMLAESEAPDLLTKSFDMCYAWEQHHIMNALAKNKIQADSLWRFYDKIQEKYEKDDIQMLFTSNHDENSWAGTEFERMGDAAPAFATLTYMLPGMPLIYNGQEAGFKRRLSFFEKDSIDWNASQLTKYSSFYRTLNAFRKENCALWSGEDGGSLDRIDNTMPDKVFSFKREKNNNRVVGVFNTSPKLVEVLLNDPSLEGEYNLLGNQRNTKINVNEPIVLPPYGYAVYYRN
ncbi:MAG: alpha-amylase family glycosyl hydrolase [Bacteroidales bacterium]